MPVVARVGAVPLHLQVVLGRERGRVYSVDVGRYVAGRDPSAHLVLPSDLVSRRHAEIAADRARLHVTDRGSSNGTFINGARVVGEGVVSPGDVLTVGDVPLRLHAAPPPALPPLIGDAPAPNATIANLSGYLTDLPAAIVLRHLAVVKKTGVLVLTSPPLEGRITFHRGHIAEVLVDTRKTRDPIQALTAILRWRGTFELSPLPHGTDTAATFGSTLLGLDAVLPAVGSQSRASMRPPR